MRIPNPNIIKEIKTLNDNDLLLDVGANIGIFSILAAQQSPQVKVIAFEPNKTIFQTLNHNISRDNLHNIYPFNATITSIDGEASLNIDNHHTGKSYIQTQQGESYNILSLSKRSLSFLKTLQFNKGIIKIDMEGCEAQVLTALDPIISMKNIKTVIIEISTEQLAQFQTTKEDIYSYFKQKKMHPQHQYQKDHYDEVFKKL